jgi:prepilin-type N-terminal cleavage/methylation domain-containing protein
MRARRAPRGFTLVEMMVVVAIIGILGLLVISASSRPVGASARTMSEQVVSIVNFAKLRAQATRRVHRIQFEPHRVSVWESLWSGLTVDGTETWTSLIQNTTIPQTVTLHQVDSAPRANPGTAVTLNSLVAYSLDVRPDGQAWADASTTANGATIFIGDGKHQFRVIVYHITGGAYARESW